MSKTVTKKDNKKVVKKTTTKPTQKKEVETNKTEKLKTGTINEGITRHNGKPLTSKTTITNKPFEKVDNNTGRHMIGSETNNNDSVEVDFSKPIFGDVDEGNVSVNDSTEINFPVTGEQLINTNQSLEDVINDINSLFTDEKKNTIINNIVRQYGQTYIAIEKANSFGTGFYTCWEIMLKEINNLKNK